MLTNSFQIMCRCILISLLFVSVQINASEYQSHKITNNKVVITTDEGVVTLTALSDFVFEVLHQDELNSSPFPSFSIDAQRASDNVAVRLNESDTGLTFATKHFRAEVEKSSMRLSFYKNDKLILQEESGYFKQSTVHGFRFKLTDSEKLLGTGERVLGMDRRGHRLPLYNRAHYGYETHSEQMNFSIPAVMSNNKYIVLFDNTANGWIDLGKTQNNILQFEANGGRSSYLVFSGNDYPELINNYVDITGKQPLPPRWVFGNHASRFGYKTQEQVLDTIAQYKADDIPVDSIILDLYWFGKDIKGHMGNLDWDKEAFPQPLQMMQQLKSQNIKTILITEPFVLTSSSRWQEAVEQDVLGKNIAGTAPHTFDFYFGNTGLLDVFSEKTQDWFGNIYQSLAKQGVDGVWGDLGEPEVHPSTMLHSLTSHGIKATGDEIHNVYGHQWANLVNNALLDIQPDIRPFIIMRSGFAGSQRYGMIPWTGDVSRSWNGLKPQVELSLQMSLLGMAYTHSDLGGFAGGELFDKEMYIRWLQYGVFQPVYRPHAQDNIAPEPVFHDKETKDIIREFIKLRYRMLPYNYSLAYQNSTSGMPLMRPMFFTDETNLELINVNDQYFWGDSFLVKPVTEPNVSSVSVTLPKGNWFDFWSNKIYSGSQTIEYPLSLSTIPVLVKAGSIIPSTQDMDNTAEYDPQYLQLDYYFDPEVKSSSSQVYDDDGISPTSLERGEYELLQIHATQRQIDDTQQVRLDLAYKVAGIELQANKKIKQLDLVIHNWSTKAKDVSFNGHSMAFMGSLSEWKLAANGVYFDQNKNQLFVKFALTTEPVNLTLIK